MQTQIKVPAMDAVVFGFDPIWTPEAYYRITLWRNYAASDARNFGVTAPSWDIDTSGILPPSDISDLQVGKIVQGSPSIGMGYPNTTVQVHQNVVTTIPIREEEAENYFSEATVHEFEMGLYNSNRLGDIRGLDAEGPLAGGKIQFGSNSAERLLFKYLLPGPSAINYFPLPQIVASGTNGTLSGDTFSATGIKNPAWIGYQLLVAGTYSDGTTVPALMLTITELRFPPDEVFVNLMWNGTITGVIWAVIAPPFSLINQETSIFGNDGSGSGSTFTDTMSNGGNSFGQLSGVDFTATPVVILINFVPFLVTGYISDTQITVGSYNGGPSTPPTSTCYWQVIFERTGYFSTPIYGLVEIQEMGSTSWEIWAGGQAQPAVSGDDIRWYHAEDGNPILDERLNKPLDAEQIYNMKFIHAVTSGLGQQPITPATVFGDSSNYYQPSFLTGSERMTGDEGVGFPNFPAAPFNILPTCARATSTGGGSTWNPTWAGHIDWTYGLKLMLDDALGIDNWVLMSDDAPIEFEGALLAVSHSSDAGFTVYSTNGSQNIGERENPKTWTSAPTTSDGSPLVFGTSPISLPAGQNYKVNFANPGQFFVPQTLFGVQNQILGYNNPQSGTVDAVLPVPRSTCWPDYLLTSWDAIQEIALGCGLVPILSFDDSGRATLYFKDRTKIESSFAGPLPVSAKPEVILEGEMGIQVSALQTFQNQRGTDGWYDDLYAGKKGHGANSKYGTFDIEEQISSTSDPSLDDTVSPRMANPYTVPGTPIKPATISTLIRYAGYTFQWYPNTQFGGQNVGGQIAGLGTFPYFNMEVTDQNVNCGNAGVFWPTLVPLIPGPDTSSILPATLTAFGPLASPPVLKDFVPVIRSRFTYTDVNGNKITTINNAHRQTIARFYSILFVQSGTKYEVEDATIVQFWKIDSNGDRTGKSSWKNIALFNTRMFPDGKRYWCKAIKRDPNTQMTDSSYLLLEANQFIGAGGNFYDGNEQIGALSPGNPPQTGGPPANGGPTGA